MLILSKKQKKLKIIVNFYKTVENDGKVLQVLKIYVHELCLKLLDLTLSGMSRLAINGKLV